MALTELQVDLIQTSFEAIAPMGEEVVERFYKKLFSENPSLVPLFAKTTPKTQRNKLLKSIILVAQNAHDLDTLDQALFDMGARHVQYGAIEEHFPVVANTLLFVLEEVAGELWTPELNDAWGVLLTNVAERMLKAYQQNKKSSEIEIKTQPKKITVKKGNEMEKNNIDSSFKSILDGTTVAFITCDTDLNITYINDASMQLFRTHQAVLKKQFPGFNADRLIGQSIDQFHQNPRVQRNLLRDPNNLPFQTNIVIGPLDISLNVSPIYDAKGEYIGAALEWKDITEDQKNKAEAARLLSMIEGSSTNMMMCNRDLRITYCNPTVINMLSNYQSQLRKVLPNFDVNRLVGVCIDDFHANASKQRQILGNPSMSPYKTEIDVVGLKFGLNAVALFNDKGEHIGSSVEWVDINSRETYRSEVSKIIEAAKAGDLSVRGDVAKMDESYRPMLAGINEVVEAIVEPISEIQEKLSRVAEGDLTAYITGQYFGDFDALKASLNGTLDSLNELLGQVKLGAEQIGTGSRELSTSSQTVSQGSTESAASLEEITASMAEMASQTKQNAENASQANKLASAARESAEGGNTQMQQMVSAMGEISQSSQSISKIIKVIDEIAFQTNLLALNAAVEAARAGVHGKGFAVVAEEVRNLAARSAKAAKETTDMIENSISKVNVGTGIANKTQVALEEIVSVVGKVTDLVSEINASSNEQAQGIAQVNQGLSQLDAVTQQNSAAAEESASASEELSGQASQLVDMLKKFKLKEAGSAQLAGLSPELMDALQKYMSAAGISLPGMPTPKSNPPSGGFRNTRSLPSSSNSHFDAPSSRRGMKISPDQIINLDDDDFGKF